MPTNLRITTTHGDIRIVEAIRDNADDPQRYSLINRALYIQDTLRIWHSWKILIILELNVVCGTIRDILE